MVLPWFRCRHLRDDGRGATECAVYGDRFVDTSWCLTREQAIAAGGLAHDWPYVAAVAGYTGKFTLSPALIKRVRPLMEQHLLTHGIPAWCDLQRACAFFSGEVEVVVEGERARFIKK